MSRLLDTIRIPLSSAQAERLERIDAEDFTGVRRKVAEELNKQGVTATDDYLDRGIIALKQYYAVALLDPHNMHAVSDIVDPFWHMHILHTKKYTDFCQDTIGSYMHHDPLDHSDSEKVRAMKRLYDYTVEVFGNMFGQIDPEFYPKDLPHYRMICFHFGNSSIELQQDSVFPPRQDLEDVHHKYGVPGVS